MSAEWLHLHDDRLLRKAGGLRPVPSGPAVPLSPAGAMLPEPPSLNRPVFGEDPEQLRTGVPAVSQGHRVDDCVEDDSNYELPNNRPRTEPVDGCEADHTGGQQA